MINSNHFYLFVGIVNIFFILLLYHEEFVRLCNCSNTVGKFSYLFHMVGSFGCNSEAVLHLVNSDYNWVQHITELVVFIVDCSDEEGCLVLFMS